MKCVYSRLPLLMAHVQICHSCSSIGRDPQGRIEPQHRDLQKWPLQVHRIPLWVMADLYLAISPMFTGLQKPFSTQKSGTKNHRGPEKVCLVGAIEVNDPILQSFRQPFFPFIGTTPRKREKSLINGKNPSKTGKTLNKKEIHPLNG